MLLLQNPRPDTAVLVYACVGPSVSLVLIWARSPHTHYPGLYRNMPEAIPSTSGFSLHNQTKQNALTINQPHFRSVFEAATNVYCAYGPTLHSGSLRPPERFPTFRTGGLQHHILELEYKKEKLQGNSDERLDIT